jgi:hypothetical protein
MSGTANIVKNKIPSIYKQHYPGCDKIHTQEEFIPINPTIGAFEISYKGTVYTLPENILQTRNKAVAQCPRRISNHQKVYCGLQTWKGYSSIQSCTAQGSAEKNITHTQNTTSHKTPSSTIAQEASCRQNPSRPHKEQPAQTSHH